MSINSTVGLSDNFDQRNLDLSAFGPVSVADQGDSDDHHVYQIW